MLMRILREARKNLGMKVFATLLAVGLWVYVINTEDPVRRESLDRPVETVGVPSGLAVVKVRPERVQVQLQGRVSGLQPASLAALRVVADLAGGISGRNTVTLNVTGVPERVEVSSLERPNVHVWLDQQFGKSLPIEVVTAGKPAKNRALLGDPKVRPGAAAVSGPEGAVERVARLVARVDLAGMEESATATAEVEALDGRGMPVVGVSLEPAKVRVDLPVGEVTSKRVPVRPRVGKPAEGQRVLDVEVSPRTVAIKGTPDAVKGVEHIDTEWQGIAKQTSDRTAYKVPLAFPTGVWPANGVRAVEMQVTIGPVAPPPGPRNETAPSGPQWPAENAVLPDGGAEINDAAGDRPTPAEEGDGGAEGPAETGAEEGAKSGRPGSDASRPDRSDRSDDEAPRATPHPSGSAPDLEKGSGGRRPGAGDAAKQPHRPAGEPRSDAGRDTRPAGAAVRARQGEDGGNGRRGLPGG